MPVFRKEDVNKIKLIFLKKATIYTGLQNTLNLVG